MGCESLKQRKEFDPERVFLLGRCEKDGDTWKMGPQSFAVFA